MSRKKQFRTEVKQLLDLVIHSLYSKKEIFLRELISNASDAIDKARYLALTNKELLGNDPEWRIRLEVDKEKRLLKIIDNGIGMNLEEVEANIGTIANSGTRRFLEELQKGSIHETPELIGQFGVGFYSAFMVASKVQLYTRRAEDPAASGVFWESEGDGKYTAEPCERPNRGTEVVLFLNEDQAEFLDEWRLRKIVKTYSDYVAYPILMAVEREEPAAPDHECKCREGGQETCECKHEDGKDHECECQQEPKKVVKDETLNSMKAIWKRPKSEVKDEEYNEFYKALTHDFNDPLATIPYAAEGATEFRALLFLPAQQPMDLFLRPEDRNHLHLYVRNVFITNDCRQLLPEYLRFVKGVVDSSDLPLNVSREILQDDAIIRRINKSLVGKVLGTLKDLQEKDAEKYHAFYTQFGRILKEGIHSDFGNADKLKELVQFESTRSEAGKFVTLKEYVARMPATQKEIYYLVADDRDSALNSPHLEVFRKKDYEVLLLLDPIDEWVTQSLTEYGEKKLVAIDRGEVELEHDEDAKKQKQQEKDEAAKTYASLLKFLQEKLQDTVREVRVSDRLTDSACCLVADKFGMTAHMERLMRSFSHEHQPTKRILELNPRHALLAAMNEIFAANPQDERLGDYAELLLNQALLTEGSPLKNPLRFTQLVSRLMVADAGPKRS